MKNNNTFRLSLMAACVAAASSTAGAVSFQATDDVELSIYGYARLNASYDIDADLRDGEKTTAAPNLGAIRTGDSVGPDGHFNIDARQSRFGITANHTSGVQANIELDFNEAARGIRLRHAYGSWNGILAGQTWSNFNTFVGNTSTLDFDSTYGTGGFQSRFAQLRYTTGALSFSIEDPRTIVAGGTKQDGSPALTVRYESEAGNLKYSAGAITRMVSYDDQSDANPTGRSDDAIGFGGFLAAKLALTDNLTVQGAFNYHDGTATYLFIGPGADAYVDANGSLETIEGYGGTAGFGLKTEGGSFNVGAGYVAVDIDDAVAAGALAATTQESRLKSFINYQWNPIKNVMYGIEYGYFQVEEQGGDDGDASRILVAAQYTF